jgi:site-specific DNA recombinase
MHYAAVDSRQRGRARKAGWWGVGMVGQPAAVYCRISRARDEDQTGVDRQERLCREVAERLGLVVVPGCVFVDNNRSAWQRSRKRPGWDALLEAIRAGRVGHVIVYHPDRLMRQPRDLEELLTVSEEHDITLHGQANRRDLSDPDDRFFLRIEVAYACRSSDDASRRLQDALEDRAREGRVHAGAQRPYGYAPGGMVIIEEEASWCGKSSPVFGRGHPSPDRPELERAGDRDGAGPAVGVRVGLRSDLLPARDRDPGFPGAGLRGRGLAGDH